VFNGVAADEPLRKSSRTVSQSCQWISALALFIDCTILNNFSSTGRLFKSAATPYDARRVALALLAC
jgi:hypothetical protein